MSDLRKLNLELLRRIINDEIRFRMPKNIRRMRKLKDELEKVLSNYHRNSLDSIAAIKHLLDIANEFQQDDIRTRQLGLTEDELAFYDLLSANEKLLNQSGPIQGPGAYSRSLRQEKPPARLDQKRRCPRRHSVSSKKRITRQSAIFGT